VHVLVVLIRNRTLSRDSLLLAMRILFCLCLCNVRSRVSDALWHALCNLSLAFLTDFTLSDFTLSDSTAVIAFSQIIHSAFRLDRKAWSQPVHMSSVLRVQQLYTAGIPLLEAYLLPMANNQTHSKERLSQNKMASSNVVRIHTQLCMRIFREVEMTDLSCSRTNRKRSSFATKKIA